MMSKGKMNNMESFVIENKSICVYPAADAHSPIIYLNGFREEGGHHNHPVERVVAGILWLLEQP